MIQNNNLLLGSTSEAPTVVQQRSLATNNTNHTFSFLATPTDGNLMIICVGTAQFKVVIAPAGWTALYDDMSRISIHYRIASSESNSYTFTIAGTNNTRSCGLEINGQNLITPIENFGVDSSGAFGTPWQWPVPNPAVALPANCLAIAYVNTDTQQNEPTVDNGYGNINPAGSGPRCRTVYKRYTTAATESVTYTLDVDASDIRSIMIKVNPR